MAAKVGGGKRRTNKTHLRVVGSGGDGRPLTVADNRTPEEKAAAEAEAKRAKEEAEGLQLMSVVAAVKKQRPNITKARDALKAEQDKLNDIFRAAKLQSKEFTRERIEDLERDSDPARRRDIEEAEAIRYRFRKAMGLPVGLSDQERELEARLPEVERDAAHWFQAGYTAGVTGQFCEPPEACVRAGHDNKFAEGHKAGMAVLVVDKGVLSGKPAAAPVKEETAAERRKREKAEEAAAREALSKPKPEAPETPSLDPVQAAIKADAEGQAGGADGFEATPEELAGQTTRQAVQAGREADGEAASAPETEGEAV